MAKTPPRKIAVKKKEPSSENRVAKARAGYGDVERSSYFRDTLGIKAPVLQDRMGQNSVYGYYDPRFNEIFFNPDQPVEDSPSGGPLAGDRTPRQVLTHEGGHALNDKDKFPSFYSVSRPTFKVPLPEDGKALSVANALKSPMVQRAMPDGAVDQFNMKNKTSVQPKKLMGILPFGTAWQPMPPSEVGAIEALDPYYSIGGIRSNSAVTSPDESFAQAFTNASGFLSETGSDTTGYREKLGRYEGNTPGAGAIVRDLFMANPIYKNHPLKGMIR